MYKRKKKYIVGAKNSSLCLISKKLDKKIKQKMKELKSKSTEPKKISYVYASHILGGGK